ncbi:DUF979 domain-containing protein [Ignavigranum ruoffiae]|uniref:Uncharacterized membrane protein n=1 Tax=Ignavigranum ruoffiae TaxID=89093 RepID=A0A1H9BJK1_9LACT|nr:DUF979 domain-containing protein [Ignavigranum ruoffiae]SEP88897.1 Uncharacterized membrane protein [Ignavigranum ruoffiae]
MTEAQWATLSAQVAEFFYSMIAIVFLALGIYCLKVIPSWKRYTTFLFWALLAFAFAFGNLFPAWVTGVIIIIIAILTFIKGVIAAPHQSASEEEVRSNADRIGFKIFIPALVIALGAFVVAKFVPGLGANNAIGVSAILGLIASFLITRAKPATAVNEGLRLLDSVGTTGILPQLLAALGAVFTAAGVGTVIANYVAVLIPDGSKFMAAAVYCIGMALFTMIMGNGFAAFSVITVGIGIPFLINQGADPVVVGALGLTAGYCGTLLTPMAANFNIMPVALLEMKNEYGIIKAQAGVAITLLIVHILLLYFFAF